MNIPAVFWHNLFGMDLGKNVGASAPAGATPSVALQHERGRSRRPRTLYFLFLAFCFCLPVQAQEVVTFSLDFPGSEPSHYAISVSSDGHSTYDSDGKLSPDADGDPFHLDFSMSTETKGRVFDLAKSAHYFDGQVDSKRKNLASTGVKILTYKDSTRSTSATYNYSPVVAVQQITQLFQNLSMTLEYGRRLEYFHHYQKLALDDELKRMEDGAQRGDMEEITAVVPILQRIASDPSVINPVRARAQRMIARAGTPKR
jgi:hypothetical protein